MPFNAKRQSSKNVDPSTFGMTLHTDQQSLILGEMITARDKLQEENQLLRDRLQDADMVIQLLHMKLEKAKAKNKAASKRQIKTSFMQDPTTPRKSELSTRARIVRDWIPKTNSKTGKSKFKSSSNKDAFRNKVAPGKKTFVAPKHIFESTTSAATAKVDPKDSRAERLSSASPVRRRIEASKGRKSQKVWTREEEKVDEGATHQSVIGKLAQVVINEYEHSSDEEHLIFE
jgi:hypothetical protein